MQKRTDRTRQARQDRQNRTPITEQAEQDRQKRTGKTGQAEEDFLLYTFEDNMFCDSFFL